jgi:transcriptional regulator with XRE-family HTH domain
VGDSDLELGAFLRSRRAAVRPEDVGLVGHGRRRVAGLRREELAGLAGVSPSYYTRIEQGQVAASPAVLDALARALALDDDERAHLQRLSRRGAGPDPGGDVERLRPGLRGLVRALDPVPAGVLGRRMDLLAWNPLCHALFAPHLPFRAPERAVSRPNWARLLFGDPRCRELFVAWEENAVDLVGRLRASAGRHRGDAELAALVRELRALSPEFERYWVEHPVQERPLGTARLRHPLVGRLELRDEVLRSPEDPDQLLVTFHADPGSPSERALHRLRALVRRADTGGTPGTAAAAAPG